MKYFLFLIALFTLNNVFSLGQAKIDSVYFINCYSTFNENNFRVNPYSDYSIPIVYNISKKNVTIKISCDIDSCKKKIILLEKSVVIQDSNNKRDTFYIHIKIQNDSVIKTTNDIFILKITSDDTIDFGINNHTVLIKEYKDIYDPDNPYKFAMGGNFDFEDGIKPKSFYAELFTFQPDLITLTKKESDDKKTNWFKTCGMYGGIYQSRYFSPDSNSSTITSLVPINNSNDTLFSRESFNRKPSTVIKNIGFYFGPTFHILGSSNSDISFNLYCSLHIEIIHQQRITNYTYETMSIDTMPYSLIPSRPTGVEKIDKKIEMVDNHYLGLGIPIQVKNKKAELNLRIVPAGFYWKTNGHPYNFYLFQFSIVERKYGICLGGEYRGNYGNKETFIGIYLSKSFDLTKLLEY